MENGLIQVLFINRKLFIMGAVSNIVRILQVVVSGNMVTKKICFSQSITFKQVSYNAYLHVVKKTKRPLYWRIRMVGWALG